MKIAIDVMGGDCGPVVTIEAAQNALAQDASLELILVGDERGLRAALPPSHVRIKIENAEDVIRMDEVPARALRHGQQSSMWRAVELVAKRQADAAVSAGNTGALMAIGRHLLGTIDGVRRPAICAALPTRASSTYMLDLGANIQCRPEQLLEFAAMGNALVKILQGKELPKIALLNVGMEPSKGPAYMQQVAAQLKQMGLNYQGFIEASMLHDGVMDVVVSDGFSGNVALKAMEGSAHFIIETMLAAREDNTLSRLANKFLQRDLVGKIPLADPRRHNGASLLGLKGVVIKSHGNADVYAFTQAINFAKEHVKERIIKRLSAAMVAPNPLSDGRN